MGCKAIAQCRTQHLKTPLSAGPLAKPAVSLGVSTTSKPVAAGPWVQLCTLALTPVEGAAHPWGRRQLLLALEVAAWTPAAITSALPPEEVL